MQKYILKIAVLAIAAVAIYFARIYTVERVAEKQANRIEQVQARQQAVIEQRLKEQQEAQEQRHLDEPVKVFVRAKDVRTCLKELNTNTISNEVVECTKDHYITAKRRDVEL
jgi:hypothetical protein